MNQYWDQSRFDAALKEYLERLPEEKIPRALNKKGFFLTLRAMKETPKKEPFEISREVSRMVLATRKNGSTGMVPVGFVIAAQRAAGKWPAAKMTRGEKNKRAVAAGRAWLSLLTKTFDSMLGGRKRASGFLRVGWLSVLKDLSPFVRDRSGAPAQDRDLRLRGVMKGRAEPARPGWRSQVTITNSAQARSDHRYGLVRIGGPALDRGFAIETADMVAFLEAEVLKEAIAKANAALA